VRSRARAAVLAVLIGLSAPAAPAADAVDPAPPADTAISPASMGAAIAKLRLDPSLGGQTKIRTLRWVTTSHPRPPSSTSPRWILGLFDLVGQFGGLLLWIAGGAAVAAAAVWILRLLKSIEPRAVPAPPDVDHHSVLDLDIHPDSLPDDVSAAAIELLHAGRLRDCLSLLYRASLSSAVHRYGVTLGAQHTEREVLKTVKGALDEVRARYFADLVAIWQRVVYAGEAAAPDAVLPLCVGYSAYFDPPPP
jgi:hypothetical protein